MSQTADVIEDATCLLADQPVSEWPYRLGDTFSVYENGVSVKYTATAIVEARGRRMTYGEPVR